MAELEASGAVRAPEEVAGLLDQLMRDIAETAGEWAATRARLLLDQVVSIGPPEVLRDPAALRSHLVLQAVAFVRSASGEADAHARLVAADHLLVSMLRPVVEGTDDEYITDEYEELRDGLDDLERLDVSNPSLNNRLSSILEELVELSMALGITEPAVPARGQQKV
jgi:hypothetical protein